MTSPLSITPSAPSTVAYTRAPTPDTNGHNVCHPPLERQVHARSAGLELVTAKSGQGHTSFPPQFLASTRASNGRGPTTVHGARASPRPMVRPRPPLTFPARAPTMNPRQDPTPTTIPYHVFPFPEPPTRSPRAALRFAQHPGRARRFSIISRPSASLQTRPPRAPPPSRRKPRPASLPAASPILRPLQGHSMSATAYQGLRAIFFYKKHTPTNDHSYSSQGPASTPRWLHNPDRRKSQRGRPVYLPADGVARGPTIRLP